jgi:hypothetical protein
MATARSASVRFRHGRSVVCDEAKPCAQRQKQRKLGVRECKVRIQSRGLTQQRGSLCQRLFAPTLAGQDHGHGFLVTGLDHRIRRRRQEA